MKKKPKKSPKYISTSTPKHQVYWNLIFLSDVQMHNTYGYNPSSLSWMLMSCLMWKNPKAQDLILITVYKWAQDKGNKSEIYLDVWLCEGNLSSHG